MDAAGKPLDAGTTNYVMTFKSAKDLPPVRGFWSLTMYDAQMFFVKNPLNRYTISSWKPPGIEPAPAPQAKAEPVENQSTSP